MSELKNKNNEKNYDPGVIDCDFLFGCFICSFLMLLEEKLPIGRFLLAGYGFVVICIFGFLDLCI